MRRVQWLTFRRRAGSALTLNFFWNFFSTFISMVLVLFNCNCVPKSFFSGQGPALEGSWGRSLLRADRGETALAPAYILILTLRTCLLLKWAKAPWLLSQSWPRPAALSRECLLVLLGSCLCPQWLTLWGVRGNLVIEFRCRCPQVFVNLVVLFWWGDLGRPAAIFQTKDLNWKKMDRLKGDSPCGNATHFVRPGQFHLRSLWGGWPHSVWL